MDEPYGSTEPAHENELSPKAYEKESEESNLEGVTDAITEETEASKEAAKRLEEGFKKRPAEEATRESDQPREIGEE